MNTVIIACQTLKNELEAAMAASGRSFEIRWIESGLHNVPKKLHATLQEHLDQCGGFDTVLLVMGYCGNSVAGIETRDFQLVMPAWTTASLCSWAPSPAAGGSPWREAPTL